MSFWTDLRTPAQHDMLVAVYETHWLTQYAEASDSLNRVWEIMSGLFALTGSIVAQAGGRQIKTLGDNGLAVFPIDTADAATRALFDLKAQAEDWLAQRGYRSRIHLKADIGPVAIGRIGTAGEEILDVFGRPVATAFTMPSTGIAITAPLFRHLGEEARKLFRKHTPPVTYIGMEDRRPRG
ncbi:MAG: adenylate/guanylate cyclase domain-containing protein [Bacteroidota bacterium]